MKKILGVLLAACFMFLPLVASAASKDKIDLSNKLITDNNQVSFNQGYKHTMEDFLHFITK